MKDKKFLGTHILADFKKCKSKSFDDIKFLEMSMVEAAEKSGAHIIGKIKHKFQPYGATIIIGISESHLSIHTWPEYKRALADFFTCGDSIDTYEMFELIKNRLESEDVDFQIIQRGEYMKNNENVF